MSARCEERAGAPDGARPSIESFCKSAGPDSESGPAGSNYGTIGVLMSLWISVAESARL
jgi:hypothetical protein